MTEKPTVAAFDFDKTITTCDTLLPFLLFAAGKVKGSLLLLLELPAIFGYLMGIVPRQKAKERVLTRFFAGRSIEEMQKLGERFAKEELNRYVKESGLERLRWHQQKNHQCVLISASINLYLLPWANSHAIDQVISSQLEVTKEGIVSGRLLGANCWGQEKLRRLIETVGKRESYTLYAYGDSRGDKDLLESADYPYYRKI